MAAVFSNNWDDFHKVIAHEQQMLQTLLALVEADSFVNEVDLSEKRVLCLLYHFTIQTQLLLRLHELIFGGCVQLLSESAALYQANKDYGVVNVRTTLQMYHTTILNLKRELPIVLDTCEKDLASAIAALSEGEWT